MHNFTAEKIMCIKIKKIVCGTHQGMFCLADTGFSFATSEVLLNQGMFCLADTAFSFATSEVLLSQGMFCLADTGFSFATSEVFQKDQNQFKVFRFGEIGVRFT